MCLQSLLKRCLKRIPLTRFGERSASRQNQVDGIESMFFDLVDFIEFLDRLVVPTVSQMFASSGQRRFGLCGKTGIGEGPDHPQADCCGNNWEWLH